MFDLKWYKKILRITTAANTSVPLKTVEISQQVFNAKTYGGNTKFKSEFNENTIDLAYYFETYLMYFDLEFKEQFNSKVANKHYGNWC